MQANRRPFFYYFPLLAPQAVSMQTYAMTSMYTSDYLKETIEQLENEKPQWIFVQRVYLDPAAENLSEYYFPALKEVLRYVRGHYTPFSEGEYLVAMKRM